MLTNANEESDNKLGIFSALSHTVSKPLGVSQASIDSFSSLDLVIRQKNVVFLSHLVRVLFKSESYYH